MSGHAFHEIFLHINWHNDHERPISAEIEPMLYEAILNKCSRTHGVYVYGIGGTETHVHIAISIEPAVNISSLIGEIKGASSFEINTSREEKPIDWMRGYGVVSFRKNELPWVLEYIKNQKEHHKAGTLSEKLERFCATP